MGNSLMPLSCTRTLRLCKVPECNGKHKAHGLCFRHYQRLRKHGDPNYAIINAGKRAEAKTLGLKRYFTGIPCPNGHIAERTTDKGACVECARIHSDAWRDKNLCLVASNDRRRYSEAPAKRKANSSRGRAARALRVVGWTERGAIAEFYALCPIGHEVDHEIPLRGRKVSGLHVLANLQYLPKQENRRKANLFSIVTSSTASRRRETGKRPREVAA